MSGALWMIVGSCIGSGLAIGEALFVWVRSGRIRLTETHLVIEPRRRKRREAEVMALRTLPVQRDTWRSLLAPAKPRVAPKSCAWCRQTGCTDTDHPYLAGTAEIGVRR